MNVQITDQFHTTYFEIIEGANIYVVKHNYNDQDVFLDSWSATLNGEDEVTNAKLLKKLVDACKEHQLSVSL